MHPRCWVAWHLLANQNSGTSMEVSSGFFMCHIQEEEVDPDYPGLCYLLHLVWTSQTVLQQQAHCPQVTLELKCCCSQLLLWVHPTHPVLCWSWWEANSSYVGSSCSLPHPWGIPHKLVHWDRTTFPQHIPYSPICPVFYESPWRQLHGIELCLQPPRPLLCRHCRFVIVFLMILSPFGLEGFGLFASPFCMFSYLLCKFRCIRCCTVLRC